MTVPQPAPDNREAALSAHDPWAIPPGREEPADSAARAARLGREALEGLAVALGVALVTGAAVGLLWWWLAPRVPVVRYGEAVYPENAEGQQAIAADGTFLLAGLAVGAVAGAVVFLLRRRGGIGVVLGVAAGAALGAWLAWRLGVWLEPGQAEWEATARATAEGEPFDARLELSTAVLLAVPFGALAGHALCVALWGPRDPDTRPPAFPGWG